MEKNLKKKCKAKNLDGRNCPGEAVWGDYCLRHYELLLRKSKKKLKV